MVQEDKELCEVVYTCSKATYQRPTSIHHWQLRDLISPADNEHEFYCVHDQRVYVYNANTQQSKVISNLEFAANSMTCSLGYLAAGGLHGELEVRDLVNNNVCFKGNVGSTVNNALHIAAHSNGEKRLFVCCNDNTVKVYKLPDMDDALSVIRCPTPINYCALSPDGHTLVAVGDLQQTYVYQATPAGYSLLTSFTEACDVGMCCAWNHHGTLFASCHQDGSVAVWEQRSGTCLARLSLPSAARCVKFAAPPLDLLAVSEHEERVNLVDARRWSSRQTLHLGSGSGGGGGVDRSSPGASRALDVSGIAFTPSGQRLWVGLEACSMSYDVDTLTRRTFGVANIL